MNNVRLACQNSKTSTRLPINQIFTWWMVIGTGTWAFQTRTGTQWLVLRRRMEFPPSRLVVGYSLPMKFIHSCVVHLLTSGLQKSMNIVVTTCSKKGPVPSHHKLWLHCNYVVKCSKSYSVHIPTYGDLCPTDLWSISISQLPWLVGKPKNSSVGIGIP